jgi:outer membrane protein OmpA-like peptidoglycan-associated protein
MKSSKLLLLFVLIFTFAFMGCKKKEEAKVQAPADAEVIEEVIVDTVAVKHIPDFVFQTAHFAFQKSNLTKAARARLNENVKFLLENPDVNVVVSGFCDDRGTIKYNKKLGMKRANAVKNYYISHGIDKSRIKTFSYGKDRRHFFSHKRTKKARAANRRAETRLSNSSSVVETVVVTETSVDEPQAGR